jgi:hypothetical protein
MASQIKLLRGQRKDPKWAAGGATGCPLLTAQSTRSELFIVRASDSVGTVLVVGLSEDDHEDVHLANRLNCVRYLVFAFAFQVAAVVAISMCCNAYHLLHWLAAF